MHDIFCVVPIIDVYISDLLDKAKFTAEQWEIEKPREEWMMDYWYE